MSKTGLLLISLLVIVLVGCEATYQARDVETSGFLKDYSILKEGVGNEALLVYKNPEANFSKYDKILFEPIELWRPAESDLAELEDEEAQRLGTYLYDSVKKQLEKDWEMVDKPGPGVLRLRGAITEAGDSVTAMNMISTILPYGRAISAGRRLITGTGSFVGKASVECEITNSQTGTLLFAAVDRRVGAKTVMGMWSSWDDVEKAYDYWGERIRIRLAEERALK